MGRKQKIHADANPENTSGPHDDSPHGGGRHPVVRGSPILYFLFLANIVCSAVGPHCISKPIGAKKQLFLQIPCIIGTTLRANIWVNLIRHAIVFVLDVFLKTIFPPYGTGQTSFEGTRGREIGFRHPGPGNRV